MTLPTTTPTTDAVPSRRPADFLFNVELLDIFVSGVEETAVDRKGISRLTWNGVMTRTGLEAAARPYEAGLLLERVTQTIERSGILYAPLPSALPFTTTGTWLGSDDAKFRVAQGVREDQLSADEGAELVNFTQTGTGARKRSLLKEARDTLKVEQFFDSGTAWQTDLGPSMLRALAACNARGKTLNLNADLFGSYPVASAVNYRGDIDIEGEPGTEINGTGYSGLQFLQLGGSIGSTEVALTSNPSQGFHEIDVTSSASFAAGDVVLLTTGRASPTYPAIGLTLSAITAGAIVNVTAASSFFDPGMVGKCIIVPGQEVSLWIQTYSSGTSVTAFVSLERQPSSTTIASGTWYINDLFNPCRYYYFKGEFKTIASIPSGTALRFTEPLDDSYISTYTVVKKVSPARVNLAGFSIRRNTNLAFGLDLSYLRNSSMTMIGGRGARAALHRARYVYGFTATKCYGEDFWYSGTGTSYGLLIGTGQDIVEIGCQYSGGNHAIAHGDLEPTRRIKVQGCVLAQNNTGVTAPALDFHGSCEDVTLIGNTATGLGISCRNVQSNGNTWRTNGKCEAVALYAEIPSDYFRFDDTIETTTAAKEAFNFTPAAPNITIGEIVVAGSVKSALGNAFVARPRAAGVVGVTVNSLKLPGIFSAPNGASVNTTIGGTAGIKWGRTELSGRYSNAAVNANVVLDAAASSGDVVIGGETSGPNGLGAPIYIESASGYRNVTLDGAQIAAPGGDRCYFGNSGILTVTGGTVFTGLASLEIATMVSGPTDVVINDSHRDGGLAIRTSTANARTYSHRSQAGNRIGYGSAPPSSGTYSVGDEFINNNCTVGSAASWQWNGTAWVVTAIRQGIVNRGDVDLTWTVGTDAPTQRFITPLTTNRTITLPTPAATPINYIGCKLRVLRTSAATGASTLSVGGFYTLAAGEGCDLEYFGNQWYAAGKFTV